MDENAVIEVVCSKLKDMGYEVIQRLTTKQRGVDVIARKPRSGEEFVVEAKGGTSSRVDSPRFGKPYSQSQIFDRAAKGVFTCLELRAKYPERKKQHVVLAVPDMRMFRAYLGPVMAQLQSAGIEVWFTPNQAFKPTLLKSQQRGLT